MVPALEATLAWEGLTALYAVSPLGYYPFPAAPTAHTAEFLISPGALSAAHSALCCLPQDTQPPHTRSMRGAFCFRRRRLCLLIRREALLCSVELLNLEAKARVSSSAARVVAPAARDAQKRHREYRIARAERVRGGQKIAEGLLDEA